MEKKQGTVLDDMKQLEERAKKQALAKGLKKIKDMAKEVIELKFETECLLDTYGLGEKDKKAIIDWINSLDDVQLTQEEKDEIKRDSKQETVKEVEKSRDDMLQKWPTGWPTGVNYVNAFNSGNGTITPGYVGGAVITTTASTGNSTLTLSGLGLEVSNGTNITIN